jgi:hypothetical protein
MPSPCRTDLLTIDGNAVGVRISGDAGPAVDGRLTIATCDGAPIALSAGRHVIRTAPGLTTGIDLDQLALVSPQFASAPALAADAAPNVVSSSRNHASRSHTPQPVLAAPRPELQPRVGGHRAHHRRVNPSRRRAPHRRFREAVWYVDGSGAVTRVDFMWTPQRAVYVALLVSGLAVLAASRSSCSAVGRRDDSHPSRRCSPAHRSASLARPVALSIVVVVAGTLFRQSRDRRALLVFAVGARLRTSVSARLARGRQRGPAGRHCSPRVASVILKQRDHDFPHDQFWPSHFGTRARARALRCARLRARRLVRADRGPEGRRYGLGAGWPLNGCT